MIGCEVDFFEFFENLEEEKLSAERCVVGGDELKCSWRVLEGELVHLLRAEKDDGGGMFGFNDDTRALIFLRRLMGLTSNGFPKSKKSGRPLGFPRGACLNDSLANGYGIRWYDHYDLQDVDRLAASLARRFGSEEKKDKVELEGAGGAGQLEAESGNFLTAKLTILSTLYSQYSADKSAYIKLSKNRGLMKGFTQRLLEAYEKEMAALEQEMKGLEGCNMEKEEGGIVYLLEKQLPLLLESLQSKVLASLQAAGDVFDKTRSKLYSRVLHYYLWVILLAKLFFLSSRKLISMVLLLDHLLICLLNHFEDYLFMLISIQFTSEMFLIAMQQSILVVM